VKGIRGNRKTMRSRLAVSLSALLLAALFGFAGFLALGADPVAAEDPKPVIPDASQPQEGPTIVKVGVYVLNVGKLDTSTGAFTIDFYLSFSSDRPFDPSKFEFANGRATVIDKFQDEPSVRFYRIQASLADSLDLSSYPFDHHNLTIELEDKEQDNQTLIYQVVQADSGLDPAVNVAGWDMDGWKAKVDEHYYAPYDSTFSRYIFSIQIHRSLTAAILKTMFPAFIIVLIGLLSLVLAPDKIIPRLTVNTGALTGAVLFHLNMTSSIPPTGYLTFGDRFMLFNYLALTLALASTLIALYYLDKKRTADAERAHKLAIVIVPVVWIGLQALNFVFL